MDYNQINEYLVDIFNNVIIIEEASLKNSKFKDVSIKEMHTIDVIGSHPETTPSAVAKELMLTLGTVTTSLNKLEQKGYIIRTRSRIDRRVVHLTLSKKGRLVYRLHRRFHKSMVMNITDGFNEEEMKVMAKGLENLHAFLEELK
ncbi:fatty acid biosynthesis transcriptional regulator FabT [Streptococcus dentiloxodontae]